MSQIKNQRGSALMLIMVLSGIGLISIVSMVQFAKPLLRSYLNTSQLATYRTTMDGFLDYAIGGVRQNKCFNHTMYWKSDCSDPSLKDLSDPYNPNRLLLSADSIEQIIMSQMSAMGPLPTKLPTVLDPKEVNWRSAIPLKSIVFEFDISGAGSPVEPNHPVFVLLENLKFKTVDASGNVVVDDVFAIKKVRFTISRVTNTNKIQNDQFAVLEFKVELFPKAANFFLGNLTLSSTAEVLFTPRTLSTHALILAGNLNLNDSTPPAYNPAATPTGARSYIPAAVSKAASGEGLRFESSVFINGDLVLPAKTAPLYSPVSFHEKVILGRGHLREGTEYFKPQEPGSFRHRLFSQLEKVGGFSRGIDLDPDADPGLDYLFFDTAPPLSNQGLNLCLARAKALVDRSVTRESRLYVAFQGAFQAGADRNFNFLLSLGKINFFVPQSSQNDPNVALDRFAPPTPTAPNPPAAPSSDVTVINPDVVNGGEKPVARVTVKMTNLANIAPWNPNIQGNEFYAFGNLSKTGQMTINFPGLTSSIVVRLQPNMVNGRAQATELQAQVSFLNEPAMANYLVDRVINTCSTYFPHAVVKPFVFPAEEACSIAAPPGPIYVQPSTLPPKVIVDIEAFDVAYVAGQTQRLYQGVNRETSAIHPFYGSRKSQQLIFTRDIASTEWKADLGAGFTVVPGDGSRNWGECITRNQIGLSPTNCDYPADNTDPLYRATAYYPPSEIYHIPNRPEVDLESFYDLCGVRPPMQGAANPAFGALDFYYSVSRDTSISEDERRRRVRNAWGFTPGYKTAPDVPAYAQAKVDDPLTPNVDESVPGYIDMLTLDENAAFADADNAPMFNVQSRVGECRVRKEANFVTGMFVCNRFIIEPRTTPLRIIGTVITGSLEIDKSAISSGIRWSSVYNTLSMFELQKVGVLKLMEDCIDPNLPHWMPVRTPEQDEQLRSCLPVSLVGDWDPFNWTLVDPDCVQSPVNAARMACKKGPRRYIAKELARRYVP